MSIPAPTKIRHFTDQGLPLHGIIHVGMNDGEEIPDYLYLGLKPVIGFEPQPGPYQEAREAFASGDVITEPIGLSDESGTLTLNIPGHLHDVMVDDSKSASAYLPARETAYEWGLRYKVVRTIDVPVERFDEWAMRNAALGFFNAARYNTLVIDVEGMELKVLRGFGDYLDGFDYLSVECSLVPIYEGQAPAEDVFRFLRDRGFVQDSPTEIHNDVFFKRP